MVILAYLLGWVYSNWLLAVALTLVAFVLWGLAANEKLPPAVRRLRFVFAALLIPFAVTLALFATDEMKITDHATGRIIAAEGREATIELVKLTDSSRTRRSAQMHYDVMVRHADGTTRSDNIEVLGLPYTPQGWRQFTDLPPRSAPNRAHLSVKCLPALPRACAVTGARAT